MVNYLPARTGSLLESNGNTRRRDRHETGLAQLPQTCYLARVIVLEALRKKDGGFYKEESGGMKWREIGAGN